MDSATGTGRRRSCFFEDDDGLASIVPDMEAGFSGNHYSNNSLVSRPQRRSSLRNLSSAAAVTMSSSSSSSSRSAGGNGRCYYWSDASRFEESHYPQQSHFLDSCFLCRKPLDNRDIFMYRSVFTLQSLWCFDSLIHCQFSGFLCCQMKLCWFSENGLSFFCLGWDFYDKNSIFVFCFAVLFQFGFGFLLIMCYSWLNFAEGILHSAVKNAGKSR